MVCWRSTSSTIRSRRIPGSGSTTGCTATALGHEVVAAALAWRLGITGADESWADPLPDELVRPRPWERLTSDVDWAVHHVGPWLGKGLRGIRQGWGIQPKRPVPRVVPKSDRIRSAYVSEAS